MDRWNDELYHHGILGMKWGVRNAETRARYSKKGVGKGKKYSTKKQLIRNGTAKDVYDNRSKLSIDELKSARDRLSIERDLRNLDDSEFRYGSRYLSRAKDVLALTAGALGSYVAIKKMAPNLLRLLTRVG